MNALWFGADRFSLLSLEAFKRSMAQGSLSRLELVTNSKDSLLAKECSKSSVVHTSPQRSLTGWNLPEPSLHWDVGIVSSFALFIPKRIISSFRLGMINIHPSLLPSHRGPAPIQFALLNGDRESGVSIIDLHPTLIDAGNVLAQRAQAIRPLVHYRELESELAELGGVLAAETLSDFETFWNGKRAQEELKVSQTRKAVDSMGEVSFRSMTAEQVSRTVRALSHQIPIKAKLHSDDRWIFMEEPVLDEDAPKDLQPGALVYKRHRQKPALFIGTADGSSIGFSAFKVAGKSSIFPAGDFYANFAKKSGSFV